MGLSPALRDPNAQVLWRTRKGAGEVWIITDVAFPGLNVGIRNDLWCLSLEVHELLCFMVGLVIRISNSGRNMAGCVLYSLHHGLQHNLVWWDRTAAPLALLSINVVIIRGRNQQQDQQRIENVPLYYLCLSDGPTYCWETRIRSMLSCVLPNRIFYMNSGSVQRAMATVVRCLRSLTPINGNPSDHFQQNILLKRLIESAQGFRVQDQPVASTQSG